MFSDQAGQFDKIACKEILKYGFNTYAIFTSHLWLELGISIKSHPDHSCWVYRVIIKLRF